MVRYQIILAYDGTEFFGSQRQAKSRRTVQGELENALRKMGWAGNSVLMAGRTDAGVHASGQVAAFDLGWNHSLEDLRNALNANLPAEMAVSRVRTAPADFHPRFNATARLYRYCIFCQRNRDPLRERYAWRVYPDVDGEILHSLAAMLPGKFDFAAFGSPPRPGGSTERHLMQASWQKQEDEWIFEVQANAFLYHMVRRLVLTQVVIAQKKVPAEKFVRALAEQVEVTSGIAPSNGLTLVEVSYPDNLKFEI
ncbi:MAG: tRNA pseudouridine(38-40) synthase TruA [Anaerolineae bacterium]|jgi:tRNA pseudouridine38-40 synthase|nr:tRNA pseudouridine(38-40) synthase TruA [Anaerolineae bacterium]MBT3713493.1 tRNA pseudouridine(38-40) synthase TruA [Anaerolineae bacterium]MBT4312105.1 tRNA pseudouridine(38-40) synthase TruA [Anaerolineae bacterium]MBT4457156.1 tRNA pseudouridine(38-40) synthase TruA [Anaerolineae bacterium]MBT4843087.1 tRNA pseudouridine(38-40) synthase TruA [Anaerolineae bacterium]